VAILDGDGRRDLPTTGGVRLVEGSARPSTDANAPLGSRRPIV